MTIIRAEVIRDAAGVPTAIILKKAGRTLKIAYDKTTGFKLEGSLTKDFRDLLAATAIFGQTAVDITAQSVGNIGVDIVAQAVGNLTVDIVAQTLAALGVDITAQSVGNLAMDIVAQSVGNINVNIAAQAGDLDVNINAQAADVDVNLNAQAAAINIDTAGGTNIVIDQLKQGAYTERRTTISNNGTRDAWTWSATTSIARGKFFPRGMRGFIDTIDAYCSDNAAAGGTIAIYISPQPEMGYTHTANITVPAGGAGAWRSANFDLFWNYDSLFIWFIGSTSDMYVGSDTGGNDSWYSTDAGASWVYTGNRYHIRAIYEGQTVGDLPVSGTVNNIKLPASTSGAQSGSTVLASGVEGTVLTINGAGTAKRIAVRVSHDTVDVRIYVDGTQWALWGLLAAIPFDAANMNAVGYDAYTNPVQLIMHNAAGTCYFNLNLPIDFQRQLVVTGYQATGGNQTIYVGAICDLIT